MPAKAEGAFALTSLCGVRLRHGGLTQDGIHVFLSGRGQRRGAAPRVGRYAKGVGRLVTVWCAAVGARTTGTAVPEV